MEKNCQRSREVGGIIGLWNFFARITNVEQALAESATTFASPFQHTPQPCLVVCKRLGGGREQSMSARHQRWDRSGHATKNRRALSTLVPGAVELLTPDM